MTSTEKRPDCVGAFKYIKNIVGYCQSVIGALVKRYL